MESTEQHLGRRPGQQVADQSSRGSLVQQGGRIPGSQPSSSSWGRSEADTLQAQPGGWEPWVGVRTPALAVREGVCGALGVGRRGLALPLLPVQRVAMEPGSQLSSVLRDNSRTGTCTGTGQGTQGWVVATGWGTAVELAAPPLLSGQNLAGVHVPGSPTTCLPPWALLPGWCD